MHRNDSRTAKRGSVLVETSLIFIAFFALLIGIFDFGQFLFIHQALVERARWAARSGVAGTTCGGSCTDTQIINLVLYGSSTAGTTSYFGMTAGTVSNGACTGGNVCVQEYNSPASSSCTSSIDVCDNYRTELRIYNYKYGMFTPGTFLGAGLAGSYNGPNITVEVPRGRYD